MKNFKIILFAFIILAGTLFSTVAIAESSLGFALGTTRGAGVTYRTLPDKDSGAKLGWQFTGLPYVTPESGFISGGISAIYALDRGKHGMLYASLGIGAVKAWENCLETSDEDENCKEESHWGIGIGPGIGFELRFWSNFGLALDVPLAVVYGDGEFKGIYPVPNTSIVYNW